jgi:hypothetical protein
MKNFASQRKAKPGKNVFGIDFILVFGFTVWLRIANCKSRITSWHSSGKMQ